MRRDNRKQPLPALLFRFRNVLSLLTFALLMALSLQTFKNISYNLDTAVGVRNENGGAGGVGTSTAAGVRRPAPPRHRSRPTNNKNVLLAVRHPELVSLNTVNKMPEPGDRCSRKLHVPARRRENETASIASATNDLFVKETDRSYFHCGTSPMVLEQHKLVFFWVPKVACSVWKILFHRMVSTSGEEEGVSNRKWSEIHRPEQNVLKYLFDYNLTYASHMMTDPSWTRAIFVRNPHERLVSAYLDKGPSTEFNYIQLQCCPVQRDCMNTEATQTFRSFVDLIQWCPDIHWLPLVGSRYEHKYLEQINFVGNFESMQADAERLLRRIGAWDRFGKTGWGESGTAPIFDSSASDGRPHATAAKERYKSQYVAEDAEGDNEEGRNGLFGVVTEYYRDDYDHPILGQAIPTL